MKPRPLEKKIRAALIAPSEGGKTFLGTGICRGLWKFHGLRSIVFDPWKGESDWGKSAWVTKDFDAWKRAVTGTKGCAVFWDEATAYGGRDRENVELFSQIRHNHPALFCFGHAYSTFLPIMRVNLTDLLIARSDPDDAAEWARIMTDPEIKTAAGLDQYQFLHKRAFRPVRRLQYTAAEIRAGISLA